MARRSQQTHSTSANIAIDYILPFGVVTTLFVFTPFAFIPAAIIGLAALSYAKFRMRKDEFQSMCSNKPRYELYGIITFPLLVALGCVFNPAFTKEGWLITGVGIISGGFFSIIFVVQNQLYRWLVVAITAPFLIIAELQRPSVSSQLGQAKPADPATRENSPQPKIVGSATNGWNITPGLEIHPITLLGPKAAVETLTEALRRSNDPQKSTREVATILTEHKLRWIELEECLEQNRPYHEKGKEIAIGQTFDVDRLYKGDIKEIAALLFHYFSSVATGMAALKFINDLRIELEQKGDDVNKWRVKVDSVKDASRCGKCKDISAKTYPLAQSPLPPFHLGCGCHILAVDR